MDEQNVIRIPVSAKQRWRNEMGDRAVQCQVSNRWLEFPEVRHAEGDDDWLHVYVMTLDANEEPKRICELVLSRHDIEKAMEQSAPTARS
jgi:hypothetical protein